MRGTGRRKVGHDDLTAFDGSTDTQQVLTSALRRSDEQDVFGTISMVLEQAQQVAAVQHRVIRWCELQRSTPPRKLRCNRSHRSFLYPRTPAANSTYPDLCRILVVEGIDLLAYSSMQLRKRNHTVRIRLPAKVGNDEIEGVGAEA